MLNRISILVLYLSLIIMLCIPFGCSTARKEHPFPLPDKEPEYVRFSQADTEKRLADASARRGEYYARRLKEFIDDTEGHKTGGIVFLGDSITEGFPLDTAFPDGSVINRGISGDKIEGVTERLDVSVVVFKPRRVYLMIGVNDLLRQDPQPMEELEESYDILLQDLAKRPDVNQTGQRPPVIQESPSERLQIGGVGDQVGRIVAAKPVGLLADGAVCGQQRARSGLADQANGISPVVMNRAIRRRRGRLVGIANGGQFLGEVALMPPMVA